MRMHLQFVNSKRLSANCDNLIFVRLNPSEATYRLQKPDGIHLCKNGGGAWKRKFQQSPNIVALESIEEETEVVKITHFINSSKMTDLQSNYSTSGFVQPGNAAPLGEQPALLVIDVCRVIQPFRCQ